MEEKRQIKRHLDKELENVHFTKHADVLNQLKPKSKRMKLKQFWNKEISIPLLPVSSAFVLFIFGFGFTNIYDTNQQFKQKEIVELGESFYWKDDIEGMIADED